MKQVSFYSVDSYDPAKVKEAVIKIINDNGGFEALFKNGKNVVIKPNLVSKKAPEDAATTHPVLVEAVIEVLKEHTDSIKIAECPGGPNNHAMLDGVYKATGIREVAQRHSMPLVTGMKSVLIPTPKALAVSAIEVSDCFAGADVIINLAKMKTHSLTGITGAAKNLYGYLYGLKKMEYHARFSDPEEFARLILDINLTLPPTLSIVDGIIGMEKNGPTGGVPKFGGALIGGTDTLSVDAVCSDFMGIDKKLVTYLKAAWDVGLIDEDIIIKGDDMGDFKLDMPFELPDSKKINLVALIPNVFGGRIGKYILPRPVINKNLCIGCGECARVCPKQTVVIKNKKAKILNKNCIKCYCCQELCPKTAVDIKRKWFMKI